MDINTQCNLRLNLQQNGKRYFTPQTQRAKAGLSQPDHQFKQGITKIQSLDFRPGSSARTPSGEERLLDLEMRDKEAKLYRQKLLQQASSKHSSKKITQTVAPMHSPGYHREMETELMRVKMKEEQDSLLSNEKSSFTQCMFNMSNILMVNNGRLILLQAAKPDSYIYLTFHWFLFIVHTINFPL